jgi:hypothetical protein
MAFINSKVAFSSLSVNNASVPPSDIELAPLAPTWTSASSEEDATSGLAAGELLAAYLVHEPHVEPIMRLLLEMNEEQRRISLAIMQCIVLGQAPASH